MYVDGNTPKTMIRLPKAAVDILANFAGRASSTLVAIAFIPFFLRLLGPEAYGLVGFFVTMQTVLLLADFGFSTTANRELAGSGASGVSNGTQALVQGFEWLLVALAGVIALIVLLAAPWLATHWVTAQEHSLSSVQESIRFMGLAIAMQLPYALYSGGLMGLGRQVDASIILGLSAIVRYGGALMVLWILPRIEVFFGWQVFAAIVQTYWARRKLMQAIGCDHKRQPIHLSQARDAIWQHMPFASRVGITAMLGLAFTQLDKLVLSKALTLADYGYYMIAWMLSSMLFVLVGPIVSAFFPRLSSEVLHPDGDPAVPYHLGCRLVSVAVMPVGALLFFFSGNVLVIWIDQYGVVENSSALVSLLALGTLLNTLAHLPHALQLAHRRPQFGLYANVVVATVVVPTLLVSVEYAGAKGAAYVWVGLNALYVAIGVPIMHKWILQGHFRRWLLSDTLLPMGTAFGTAFIVQQLLSPAVEQSADSIAALVATYLLCLSACVLVIPDVRQFVLDLRKQRSK